MPYNHWRGNGDDWMYRPYSVQVSTREENNQKVVRREEKRGFLGPRINIQQLGQALVSFNGHTE